MHKVRLTVIIRDILQILALAPPTPSGRAPPTPSGRALAKTMAAGQSLEFISPSVYNVFISVTSSCIEAFYYWKNRLTIQGISRPMISSGLSTPKKVGEME